MKNACFVTVSVVVSAALLAGSGCGGIVGLGNVSAEGGNSSTAGDSGTTSAPDGGSGPQPTPSCAKASDATDEVLDTSSYGEITDFAGDGRRVYVAMNYIANFQAGHILLLPHLENSMDELANVSPRLVGHVGLAKGFVAFEVKAEGDAPPSLDAHLDISPPGSTSSIVGFPAPDLSLFATHPSRGEVPYLSANQVRIWTPAATPPSTLEMTIDPSYKPTSLAMNAEGVVIVLQDALNTVLPAFSLVRKPLTAGGANVVIASATATALSNVAVDETSAYVVMNRGTDVADFLVKIPLDGSALDPAAGNVLATFVDASGARARIVTTDTHVYVGRVPAGTCQKAPCADSLALVRVAKTGPASVENVSTFTGPSEPSGRRAFNVDACYLYWSDGSKLWRRAIH
jgi:hypothetical protein